MSMVEVLEKNGWTKGTLRDEKGRVCLLGALQKLGIYSNSTSNCMSSIILDRFPDRMRDAPSAFLITKIVNCGLVPFFNDHDDTTYEDVILVAKEFDIQWEAK